MAYGTFSDLVVYAATQGYQVDLTPALLARASRVLDALYEPLFVGEAIMPDQSWPRTGVPNVSPATVPQRVIHAAYELAIMEARAPGTFDGFAEAIKRGPVLREKAGEVEVAYADPTKAVGYSMTAQGRPLFVDGLLHPYINIASEVPVIYVV